MSAPRALLGDFQPRQPSSILSPYTLAWFRGEKGGRLVPDKDLVYVDDVSVLRMYDWALFCRIQGKEIAVPLAVIRSPTPLPLAGQRVTLGIEKWFAVAHGLE